MYDRIGAYNLDEVLPNIGVVVGAWYADKFVRLDSLRLKLFARKGVKCIDCGIEATFFALERHHHQTHDKWHMNLYAIDKDGIEVMLTKDHIIPVTYGGKNHMDNLQPMCSRCNNRKAAKCSLPKQIAKEEYEAILHVDASIRSVVSKLTHLKASIPGCAHEFKESARFMELARYQVRSVLDAHMYQEA